MSWLTSRRLFLALFLVCSAMMAFGYYLQFAQGLEPCPLCITQRIFIVAVGITALAGALHGPRSAIGVRVYAAAALLFGVIGGGFSARHVWLQNLPEGQAPACAPPLEYLLENFPPGEALSILLRGDGNCAVVDWSLLGLSIPAWTLAFFVCVAIVLGWTVWTPRPQHAGEPG